MLLTMKICWLMQWKLALVVALTLPPFSPSWTVKLGITEAVEMRQWMRSFYTMLATSKSPSNNTDSKHHSCKWSVNGMTCLTTQCNICHLLLAIIEQHGTRFPLFKSFGTAKHSIVNPFTLYSSCYPIQPWRECSASWEGWRQSRELHSPREPFRIS